MGEFVRARWHDHATLPTDPPAYDVASTKRVPVARWLRPGVRTSIGGHHIVDGMIYLGRRLPAARGGRIEPALVDPDLELARWCPEAAGKDLGYWPSYDRIPPESRAAYLHWLADGRRAPDVPIGFVFLFFYGLERRLLHDIDADPSLLGEVPQLAAEVQGLLSVYGTHTSFRRYATEFANLLELIDAPTLTRPEALAAPELREPRWPPPMTLRRGLGAFAAERRPLPPEWALAWAWYHPDISLRTPAFRCPQEFAQLFRLRYVATYGDGLQLDAGDRTIRVEYQPASAGLRRATYARPDIPEVFLADEPRELLAALVDGVVRDLTGYSRWVRRHVDQRETLAAAALLPPDLVIDADGRARHRDVAGLQIWLERQLGESESATLDADQLLARWPTATPGTMTSREAAALCQLLGHLEIGLEPDVRLGGPAPASGQSVVIFRAGQNPPPVGSVSHVAAVTFAQLAAAVAAGDGEIGEDERRRLVDLVSHALHLGEVDRIRLSAHLRWLATTVQARLPVFRRRLAALPAPLRAKVGELLVTAATSDGVVLPHHVASLIAGYRRLGLDPDTVPNRLHASLTTLSHTSSPTPVSRATAAPPTRPGPAATPVTVRTRAAAAGDFALPPRPVVATPAAATPTPAYALLDTATVEAKLAETDKVATLLHGIFADAADDEPPSGAAPGNAAHGSAANGNASGGNTPAGNTPVATAAPADVASDPVELIAGLDAPHSALLRALADRTGWPRCDFDALAASLGLLPAGALDVLNEAALDATDDPLTTGDDDLEIDACVLEELLA